MGTEVSVSEASLPGVTNSPIHVQVGIHHVHAVRVCTNNSVFATTLFARHNLADLSRHPLFSGAAIYYCRAAQEQFLKSLFLYNLVWYYSQLKRSLVWLVLLQCITPGSLTMMGVHCTGSLIPLRPQSYCKQHFLVLGHCCCEEYLCHIPALICKNYKSDLWWNWLWD